VHCKIPAAADGRVGSKTRAFVSRSHGSFLQLRTCRNVNAGRQWAKSGREPLQQILNNAIG
jgi:hypothetical protein